jgi:nucleoprotein TPR
LNESIFQHASVIELQSKFDALSQTCTTAQATLQSTQYAYQAQSRQLSQTLEKVNDLQAQLADRSASFQAESTTQTRLIDLLERREEESKRRLEVVDAEWEALLSRAAASENRLKDQLEVERAENERLLRELEIARTVGDRFASGDFMPPDTPGTLGTPGPEGTNISFALSPTARLATRLQRNGRSYTEVYTDYVRLSDELAVQKKETMRLENVLAQVLADIEERVRFFDPWFVWTLTLTPARPP